MDRTVRNDNGGGTTKHSYSYLLGRSGLRVSRLALGTMNFGVEGFHAAYGKTEEEFRWPARRQHKRTYAGLSGNGRLVPRALAHHRAPSTTSG